MDVAASPVPVGVRALKNNLSHYLERVRDGEQILVTDRGRPIARLVAVEASTDRLADLIGAGIVQPARRPRQKLVKRVTSAGPVIDLVAEPTTVTTYVDTSTLIKLVVDEPGSERSAEIRDASDSLVSVSLVTVEAHAALAAARRRDRITSVGHRQAKTIVVELIEQLDIVLIDDELVHAATHLAEHEALRADDAVHLAAALRVHADLITSADRDLNAAAARRGLNLADPTDAP